MPKANLEILQCRRQIFKSSNAAGKSSNLEILQSSNPPMPQANLRNSPSFFRRTGLGELRPTSDHNPCIFNTAFDPSKNVT
jgi:hypothetical protein